MRRQDKLNFAKFLISLSFVFIAVGVSLTLEKDVLYTAEEKTYVITSPEKIGTISITTITENDPKSQGNNQKNNIVGNLQEDQNNIIDINTNLKNKIESVYGINIKYGNETKGYTVGGLQIDILNDNSIINQTLNNLNYNLSLYPSNFFAEIRNYGYQLTIYLIKEYSQKNVTGITDSTNNNVVISIASNYAFAESFHHEIYHYIEKYIYSKGGRYTTWNNLNPKDFQYGTVNRNLSYSSTNDKNAYFVNNYAQTDEEEDRASTFEYMTATSRKSCFDDNVPIKLKAKTICEQINAVFHSVNSNTQEYWERYVY